MKFVVSSNLADPDAAAPGDRCRLRLAGAAKIQDTPAGAELFA
jgi:hypothetical protein